MYKTSNFSMHAFQLGLVLHSRTRPLDRLAVRLDVMMLVLEEEILVAAVGSESDSRDAEAGKTTPETVPTGVGALVSPGLTGEKG